MDLEENRDKYEARLRAVEQGYEAPATAYDYDMPPAGRPVPVPLQRAEAEAPQEPDPYDEEPVYGERQPYRPYRSSREEPVYQEEPAYAEEPGYAEDGFGEAGDEAYGGEAYQDDAYYGNEAAPYGEEEPYPEDGFGGAAYEEEPEEPYAETPGYAPYGPEDETGGEPEVYEDEYAPEGDDAVEAEYGPEQGAQGESAAEGTGWPAEEETLTQEALAARVHEAEVQASLARELSRLSGAEFSEESRQAQTRVLKDLRSLKTGDDADDYAPVAARVSNHLMIESEDPDEGLALAIDALKKVHRELGIKNQAAKITGEKLNQKGVLALADKLTGKDLIIEYAGDMSDEMLQELDLLMARDETGMNVVMIDNREQLEAIHRQYPGLAKRFECIGEAPALKAEARPEAAPAAKPVAAVKKVMPEPGLPPEAAVVPARPAAPVKMPAAEPAAPAFRVPEPPMAEKAPVRPKVVKQEPVYEDEYQDQYEPGDYEEPYEDEGTTSRRRKISLRPRRPVFRCARCLRKRPHRALRTSRRRSMRMTGRRWTSTSSPSMHVNMPAKLIAASPEKACWPSMSALRLWRKTAFR